MINKKELQKRWDYWDINRGGYIMSKEYRQELYELLFKGKTRGLAYRQRQEK